jgi:hypothetical protein
VRITDVQMAGNINLNTFLHLIRYTIYKFALLFSMNLSYAKTYIIVISFFCLPALVQAQDKELNIKGIFYRKNTSERIAQATVTDLKSQIIMMSDELGGFNIKASVGDTLVFNRTGYTQEKQVVTGPGDMVIYLQPVIVLKEVTIKEQSTKQELNDIKAVYRSKGLYFDGKPPLLAFIFSPLTAFYELFSADAIHERHFAKFSKDELEVIEVDRRYTKELVKRVTALPDTDVLKFMQQYRPSYEDMHTWNDYDLISHIKKYLEYYKTHKDGIPMQKLY